MFNFWKRDKPSAEQIAIRESIAKFKEEWEREARSKPKPPDVWLSGKAAYEAASSLQQSKYPVRVKIDDGDYRTVLISSVAANIDNHSGRLLNLTIDFARAT